MDLNSTINLSSSSLSSSSTSSWSSFSSSSSTSSTQKLPQSGQTCSNSSNLALKKKLDDLLTREAQWKRVKALRREARLCHWADCPYAGVCINNDEQEKEEKEEAEMATDLWTHILDYHIHWQPYFGEDGRLLYATKGDGDDQHQQQLRNTRSHKREYVCLWEQCSQAGRLMRRGDLIAHIKRCHLLKSSQLPPASPPPSKLIKSLLKVASVSHPSREEFTPELLDLMKAEVQADLRSRAGLEALDEPTFKWVVRTRCPASVDGEQQQHLRELKPGEHNCLSEGETVVLALDERFYGLSRF